MTEAVYLFIIGYNKKIFFKLLLSYIRKKHIYKG